MVRRWTRWRGRGVWGGYGGKREGGGLNVDVEEFNGAVDRDGVVGDGKVMGFLRVGAGGGSLFDIVSRSA